MTTLLTIFFIVVTLVAIFLLTGLFVKNDFNIERKIVIDKPVNEVFHYIRHLKNQDQYSKWVMMDPNMKKDFRGTDGAVGFVYAWDGNREAGKGEQEIIRIDENKMLEVELRFEKPFKSVAQAPFVTEAVSETQTRVTWTMSGTTKYPMNVMNLITGGLLVIVREESLHGLKNRLEQK